MKLLSVRVVVIAVLVATVLLGAPGPALAQIRKIRINGKNNRSIGPVGIEFSNF